MAFADVVTAIADRRATRLALPLVVAVPLAIVGAFGTYASMTLPLRLLHFISIGLVVGALAFALSEALRRYWLNGRLPVWARLLVAVVTAPPGALVVHQALALWAPGALAYVSDRELLAQVLALNVMIGGMAWLLPQRVPPDVIETPAVIMSDQALRAKLPLSLRRAAILALSAEDHYVRVRTDRGEALVLMNLTAAIAALGAEAGVRIHRSHWVSRRLAETVTEREGVRVGEGTVLPVSRSGRKLLREIGAR